MAVTTPLGGRMARRVTRGRWCTACEDVRIASNGAQAAPKTRSGGRMPPARVPGSSYGACLVASARQGLGTVRSVSGGRTGAPFTCTPRPGAILAPSGDVGPSPAPGAARAAGAPRRMTCPTKNAWRVGARKRDAESRLDGIEPAAALFLSIWTRLRILRLYGTERARSI